MYKHIQKKDPNSENGYFYSENQPSNQPKNTKKALIKSQKCHFFALFF